MTGEKHIKLIREGQYVAEVEVELLNDEPGPNWGSYLSLNDALRLDDVRQSLRTGRLDLAGKQARIYRLEPVTAA